MDRELKAVLQAQRVVMRQAHRMLLLIALRPSDEADQILALAQGVDLNAALWQTGLEVGQNLDVIMIPAQIDPTSCFRLAPLCFLGQSLFETGQGQSPYQAAALGAAIIVGPFVGAHKADYDRLDEAGGLRRVIDPNELATAVLQMSAPEQAAQTSLAAWTVVSQGAEVTDALTALALDQLGS
jgi:3-deoxy-D-manno-octulosonic-acid transferase